MYILAGPNGSGKTSVLMEEIPKGIVILNADKFSKEIAEEQGIPKDIIQAVVNNSEVFQLAGSRKLIECMRQAIKEKETFAAETTLDVNSYKKRHIKDAKSNGFEVELLYVGTESPQINIARVTDRVADGGHVISPEKIVDRYYGSLERLSSHIEMVDRAKIYDNSVTRENVRRILSINHGKIVGKNEPVPDWINKNVIEKLPHETRDGPRCR